MPRKPFKAGSATCPLCVDAPLGKVFCMRHQRLRNARAATLRGQDFVRVMQNKRREAKA